MEVLLMKKILVASLFMLATLAWAAAQQPGSPPARSGQAPSQVPDASQSQPAAPGADQNTAPSGSQAGQSPMATAPVTEGCLGGKDPNYTITDKAGTTYQLNIPPTADTSKLAQHVGESVQVAGNVKDAGTAGSAAINVQGIGRGTGKCPASGSSGAQPPPKP
jgi:cytoskeletal protein RodZ